MTVPDFNNMDFSIIKYTKIGERIAQFRVEFFDVLNHANFGQPGNVVGSPTFGRITNTRFPTGCFETDFLDEFVIPTRDAALDET